MTSCPSSCPPLRPNSVLLLAPPTLGPTVTQHDTKLRRSNSATQILRCVCCSSTRQELCREVVNTCTTIVCSTMYVHRNDMTPLPYVEHCNHLLWAGVPSQNTQLLKMIRCFFYTTRPESSHNRCLHGNHSHHRESRVSRALWGGWSLLPCTDFKLQPQHGEARGTLSYSLIVHDDVVPWSQ